MEVFELAGAGPARTRLQAFAARGLTPFVGRQAELAALHQALEQAGAGHGQVVAVVGEPGVGKSRLFAEFLASPLTEGWRILESHTVSYGQATPYLPIRALLKAYAQIDDRDDARAIREKVDKCLTLDVALQPTRSAVLALLDVPASTDPEWQALEPSQRRLRTIDGVKRLLLRQSQVQPLLVSIENLHWIDAGTPGRARQPHREPADERLLRPRELSPRVPARLGQQDLLHATAPGPAAAGQARTHSCRPCWGTIPAWRRSSRC